MIRDNAELNSVCEIVKRNLPEGYQLKINVSEEGTKIYLQDVWGCNVTASEPQAPIHEQLTEALELMESVGGAL